MKITMYLGSMDHTPSEQSGDPWSAGPPAAAWSDISRPGACCRSPSRSRSWAFSSIGASASRRWPSSAWSCSAWGCRLYSAHARLRDRRGGRPGRHRERALHAPRRPRDGLHAGLARRFGRRDRAAPGPSVGALPRRDRAGLLGRGANPRAPVSRARTLLLIGPGPMSRRQRMVGRSDSTT
jgi:hypothetical protein